MTLFYIGICNPLATPNSVHNVQYLMKIKFSVPKYTLPEPDNKINIFTDEKNKVS